MVIKQKGCRENNKGGMITIGSCGGNKLYE